MFLVFFISSEGSGVTKIHVRRYKYGGLNFMQELVFASGGRRG